MEGFSTQVVVDRPGSEGTEKHFNILIQLADAMLRPHPFPDFGNANTQGPEAPPFQEVTEIAWMILQTRAECVARAAPGLGYSSEHVDGITTANNKHETGTCCHERGLGEVPGLGGGSHGDLSEEGTRVEMTTEADLTACRGV